MWDKTQLQVSDAWVALPTSQHSFKAEDSQTMTTGSLPIPHTDTPDGWYERHEWQDKFLYCEENLLQIVWTLWWSHT
jgi:hypothetical protein